jgi:hypothetical protein
MPLVGVTRFRARSIRFVPLFALHSTEPSRRSERPKDFSQSDVGLPGARHFTISFVRRSSGGRSTTSDD